MARAGGAPAPLRYEVIPGNNAPLVEEALQRRGRWAPHGAGEKHRAQGAALPSSVDLRWRPTRDSLLPPRRDQGAAALRCGPPLVNHFERLRDLCTKDGLYASLAEWTGGGEVGGGSRGSGGGDALHAVVPPTFVVDTEGAGKGELSALGRAMGACAAGAARTPAELAPGEKARAAAAAMLAPADAGGGVNLWILKPAALNRGRGVRVVRGAASAAESSAAVLAAAEAENAAASSEGTAAGAQPRVTRWVVQKYLERPLLLAGRKFDVRAYVALRGDWSAWMCELGYLRMCSETFDLASESTYAHVANTGRNASNAEGMRSAQAEVAAELGGECDCKLHVPLAALAARIDQLSGGAAAWATRVWPAMRRQAALALAAARAKGRMRRSPGYDCFELLGLDFMLSDVADGLRVSLIEVNTNPAIMPAGSPLLEAMLPEVMDDLLAVVADPLFPPRGGRLTVTEGSAYSGAARADAIGDRGSFKRLRLPQR